MFGDDLTKGVLVDILNDNEIFVSGNSRYNFIDVKKSAALICNRFNRNGILDIGAKDSVSINEIIKHLDKDIPLGNRLEIQETVSPESDFPSAKEVLKFLDEIIKEGI
jgi:hypothetical protein